MWARLLGKIEAEARRDRHIRELKFSLCRTAARKPELDRQKISAEEIWRGEIKMGRTVSYYDCEDAAKEVEDKLQQMVVAGLVEPGKRWSLFMEPGNRARLNCDVRSTLGERRDKNVDSCTPALHALKRPGNCSSPPGSGTRGSVATYIAGRYEMVGRDTGDGPNNGQCVVAQLRTEGGSQVGNVHLYFVWDGARGVRCYPILSVKRRCSPSWKSENTPAGWPGIGPTPLPTSSFETDIKYGYIAGEDRFFFVMPILDVFDRCIVAYHIGLSL